METCERDTIRQKVLDKMVKEKGYEKEDFEIEKELVTSADNRTHTSLIDLVIRMNGRYLVVIRCAPGSVVTREKQLLASARLLDQHQVPLAIQTNGSEVEILDVLSGKELGEGWQSVPSKKELLNLLPSLKFEPLPEKRAVREARILRVFDEMT